MDRKEIYEKLRVILSTQLSIEIDKIETSSLIARDLGADSLDTAEIAMAIHEEFGYDMSDEDVKKIKTVGDILDCLEVNLRSERT